MWRKSRQKCAISSLSEPNCNYAKEAQLMENINAGWIIVRLSNTSHFVLIVFITIYACPNLEFESNETRYGKLRQQ